MPQLQAALQVKPSCHSLHEALALSGPERGVVTNDESCWDRSVRALILTFTLGCDPRTAGGHLPKRFNTRVTQRLFLLSSAALVPPQLSRKLRLPRGIRSSSQKHPRVSPLFPVLVPFSLLDVDLFASNRSPLRAWRSTIPIKS